MAKKSQKYGERKKERNKTTVRPILSEWISIKYKSAVYIHFLFSLVVKQHLCKTYVFGSSLVSTVT